MLRIASRISRCVSGSMPVSLRHAVPHERAVVGGHRVVRRQLKTVRARLGVERLEIPHTARRIAMPEEMIEGIVALARMPPLETERAIHAQHSRALEHRGDSAEEIAH